MTLTTPQRLLVVAALVGLFLAAPAGQAQAAGVPDVGPSDPVVRLLLLAAGAGLLLALVGGSGLWLTRRRR